jgi:hypothetical protein
MRYASSVAIPMMTMRARSAACVTLALLIAACDDQAIAPTLQDVLRERSLWSAHNLSRYAYRYELTGFMVSYAGHPLRLVVLADTVRSATDMTTGDSVPGAAAFPTLDGLYNQAITALSSGTLKAIAFDSTFNYPSRMDFLGPPDASGSVLASSLELLP